MAAVTFGDLLYNGAGHLEAAGRWDREEADPLAAVLQLRRLVDAIGRYAVDAASSGSGDHPADLAWWPRARDEIEQSLQRASEALHRAAAELGGQDPAELEPGLPLGDAATALLAARDLLATHQPGTQVGARAQPTEWTQVISSQPVTKAVTDLAAWWCEQLAPLAGHLAGLRPGDQAGLDIAEAGQWLSRAAAAAGPARVADPVSAQDRTLLFAIPPAGQPRERPQDGETPAELCQGVTLSAGRLQAAARVGAWHAATSAVATAGAWRWTATAGAVTGHLSAAMLGALASRAGPLGLPGSGLDAAAAAVTAAQEAWQRVTTAWGLLTTETRFLVVPAVTEASDLIVRLGRLACDNPQWTPQAAHQAPLRAPDVLAPDAAAAAVVIAAVHHAACAFEQVAAADLAAVKLACRARRLYVPTRALEEMHGRIDRRTIPRVYRTAQVDRTGPLLEAYQAAVTAAARAAQLLDQVALEAAAPSRTMALAREAAPRPAPEEPGGDADATRQAMRRFYQAGPVERQLAGRGVTDPVLLERAAFLDAAGRTLLGESGDAKADPGPAADSPWKRRARARAWARQSPPPARRPGPTP